MLVWNREVTGLDRLPPPGPAECHVWRFPLLVEPSFRACLAPDEQARADRYKIARPREQFIAARGNLRRLLARYLGALPEEVEIVPEPDGKPVVRGSALHFNVSHSGGLGLIAVGHRRVGVDVEEVRDVPNAAGLVERFFGSEEAAQFSALPADLKLAGFFRGWTCKEALLKAVGTGIQNVDKCVVDLDPRRGPVVVRFDHAADEGAWRLGIWSPDLGYVAAIALECRTDITVRDGTK